MAFDQNEITTLASMVADDPKLQREIWSEAVRADVRDLHPLKDFIGGEGSGLPICEKRDAAKKGGQKVNFTSRAALGGRGVIHNAELKSKTARLRYGGFGVTVDLRRFAISEEQIVEYFSLPGAAEGNREELMLQLCRDWWVSTVCADSMIVLRNKALFGAGQPNVLRVGNGADRDAITVNDTYDTGAITDGKNQLIALGALAMQTDKAPSGADVPQYLVFAPNRVLDQLEDDQKFREAVNNNQVRGDEAFWFNGKYPRWKNNVIFHHNIVIESGPVRQGSPLLPVAFVGVPIANAAATSITGGGKWNADGSLTEPLLYDFFSYFGGFAWKTYAAEVLPTDNNDYYAIILNTTGADRGKYEIVKWTAAGNNGNTLTVTREVDEVGVTQKTILTAAGRYTNAHPTGSLIIPCNKYGVPIGHALHMGQEALMVAKGELDAEPIEHKDDFGFVQSQGIASIIGYSPWEDSEGRYPNYLLVECAVDYPEHDLVDIRAAL